MEKIKIFYLGKENHVEEIINTILKNKKDINERVKLEVVAEFPIKFNRSDVIILEDKYDQPDKLLNKIYLYDGELNSKIVKHAQENSVYAIFNSQRFYGAKMEYDEIARFENVLKKLLRGILSNFYLESESYKNIDWKIKISKDDDKFISMFSDENMRDVVFKVNKIIDSLKPLSEQFRKFRKEIKGDLEKLRSFENSQKIPKDLVSTLKQMEEKVTENLKKLPSIMITGPTGSGKTLFAKYIAKKFLEDEMENFAKVPIVNIGDEIVDSELFGSFPGAFTDSLYKMGKMLANAGGVIFLDEIGEIPPKIQAKLLTYFDDMRILIDGYSNPRGLRVPVLIIAATNKELKTEIEAGNFRQDLFERFDYSIKIPSLKERMSDFRYILSFVIQDQVMQINKERDIKHISLKAIEKLENYGYPGNFRELENVVREAINNAYFDGRDYILERDVEL